MIRLAAVALIVTAPALLAAPVPKELLRHDRLEGTWRVESLVTFGKPSSEALCWVIDADGNLARNVDPAAPLPPKCSVVLKFDRASKHLDFCQGGTTFAGLYRLRGDRLEICLSIQGGERPAAVEAGPRLYLWTLERLKPEEKK